MTVLGDPMFVRGLVAGLTFGLAVAALVVAICFRVTRPDDDFWKGDA